MAMKLTESAARIRTSEKDRHARRGLIAQLTSGQSVPWQKLDEPSRIVRRLLDLDLDADIDLLWGDEADASRAYRDLLRVARNPSARSLDLGSAAARTAGLIGLDTAMPLGNACLIAANVILTSTEVLASPDDAFGWIFTSAAHGRGLPIVAELAPSQFFYAHGELGSRSARCRRPRATRSGSRHRTGLLIRPASSSGNGSIWLTRNHRATCSSVQVSSSSESDASFTYASTARFRSSPTLTSHRSPRSRSEGRQCSTCTGG